MSNGRDEFSFFNPWRIVGAPPGCSLDELRKAYRNQVKRWHPDQFANNPAMQAKADEQMKLLNEAFTYLKERAEAHAADPASMAPQEDFATWRARPREESQRTAYERPTYTPPRRSYTTYSDSTSTRTESNANPADASDETERETRKPAASSRPSRLFWARIIAAAAALGLGAYAGWWFLAAAVVGCALFTISQKLRDNITIFHDFSDALFSFAAGACLAAGYHWMSAVGLSAGIALTAFVLMRSVDVNGIPDGIPVGVFKIVLTSGWLALPQLLVMYGRH